jgi:catechol 2,3-dioxygenase-like lactoylglutathione lyase family enzyme
MIQRVSHASVYVFDQDAARDFYVNKLGFDVRMDQSMDNGFRWLTVSPRWSEHPTGSGGHIEKLDGKRPAGRRRAAGGRYPYHV